MTLRLFYSQAKHTSKHPDVISIKFGSNGQSNSSDFVYTPGVVDESRGKCSEVLFSEQIVSESGKIMKGGEPSNLSLMQYDCMSKEEKSCVNNCV